MRKSTWLSALCVLAATSHSVWADDSASTATVTVNVTITSPPCVINNNQTIDVNFGSEVAVTDVAAGLAEKPIAYAVYCSDTSKSLTMTIQGTSTDFDADALQTSMTDLGVKIKANGSDYPLNTAFSFASDNMKPALTALLVQKPGARLQTGEFSAGATMKVDYQ